MTQLGKHNSNFLVTISFIARSSLLFVLPTILSAQTPPTEGDKLPELGHYYKNEKVGTVNLRVVEGNFRIYFVDKEKNIVSPAFKKARLDVELVRNKTHEYTLSLKLSEDGRYLTSTRHTHPPYRYWVRLVLLHESNSDNNLVFSRTQFSQ
jgi:hypothetical protein